MFRTVFLSGAAAALAGSASAQVFVVGGGLAAECFELAKRGTYSYRSADETCSRALREETLSRKNRASTLVNRGVIRMREGDYEEALDDYAQAIDMQPELGAAYLNQGAAYIYLRDYSAALGPLNRAIELDTTDIFAAYYNRAIAREHTGDVPGAYYDFQKALELRPEWELAERQLSRFTVEGQ